VSVVRGGSQTVYIKDESGQPKAVSITTGVTNGTMTEVIGGDLQPGMEVITGELSGKSTKRRRPAGSGGGQPGAQ
jgi:HlyD family secretion protein